MRPTTPRFGFLAVAAFTVGLLGASGAWAQQKHTISSKAPAANTKYVQQHLIDAGDVPGHQVRIYEIQRTFAGVENGPAYEGVRVKETWDRGYSDYTNGNGRTWGYSVSSLENGDKIFSQFDGASQTVPTADGSKRSTYTGITKITGGTGKFTAIRGLMRSTSRFNAQAGVNESDSEGEYWFEDGRTAESDSASGARATAAPSPK